MVAIRSAGAALCAALALVLFRPACGGVERAPIARVGYEGTLPRFYFNGVPTYPFIDLCGCAMYVGEKSDWIYDYLDRSIAALGPRVLHVGVEGKDYRRADGTRDWSTLEARVMALLKRFPDAKIMPFLRFRYDPWAAAHPDECVGYDGAPIVADSSEWSGTPLRPSSASERWKAEMIADVRSYGAYVRSRPWGAQVVGTRLAHGVATEWFTYGTQSFSDTGVAMTRAFRRWLARKYGTDANLRASWRDSTVTLATATVPTRVQRTTNSFFLDPATNRRTIDFNEMSGETMADLLIAVARATKAALPERLVGVYYGYCLAAWPGNSANYHLERVAASGAVDFFCDMAPYNRDVRAAGGDYQSKSVSAVCRRHGCLHILEDDSRLSFSTNWQNAAYTSASPQEDRAILRRNILNTLFDREGYQICDPQAGKGRAGRPHCFDNPLAIEAQRAALGVLRGIASLPEDSGAQTALVVGWRDRFYGDTQAANPNTGRGWARLLRCVPLALHRSGAVFDLLSTEDLLAAKKRYANYIFLTAYSLDARERAHVRKLTRAPGVQSVWIVAPGSIAADGFSDAAMSELVGMDLTGAGANPRVTARDPAAQRLTIVANSWVKNLGAGARSIFLAEMPYHETEAATLMAELGEHRYTAPGRYVRRHGDCLMVHVGAAGAHRVTLPPGESHVFLHESFTGQTFGPGRADLTSTGPETWFFRLSTSPSGKLQK